MGDTALVWFGAGAEYRVRLRNLKCGAKGSNKQKKKTKDDILVSRVAIGMAHESSRVLPKICVHGARYLHLANQKVWPEKGSTTISMPHSSEFGFCFASSSAFSFSASSFAFF